MEAPDKAPAVPAAKPKQKRFYMVNLDGLRGIGIIEVILYHMGYRIMRHAWLCISIFFALSGFLITGITVHAFEKTGTVDVPRFWSRRVGRLFPALFLVIILCAVSRFFRGGDEAQQWWEKNDLLWATTWLENYNLVYVRMDDYFAAHKPSIARHLWTLAIEEQYYLVWPVVFYLWCRCFPSVHAREDAEVKMKLMDSAEEGVEDQTKDVEDAAGENAHIEQAIEKAERPLLKLLCVAECTVIVFSYFSSWVTIQELGMSAAYYSTWSRMGDLACGGLTYLLVRLHPQLYARCMQKEGIPKMNNQYRIVLEFGWFLCLCLAVLPPMVQVPLDDALHFYFYYFRLPFSFGVTLCSVAGVLQLSEPLPSWAVFSRLTSNKFLAMLGMISYGVYLNHWPLILFFGDPIDHDKLELAAGGEATDSKSLVQTLIRDAFIMMASLAFGLISFLAYEKPLLMKGAKTAPWKVICCGFAGVAFSVAVVMACYAGVKDPRIRNDTADLYQNVHLEDVGFASIPGLNLGSEQHGPGKQIGEWDQNAGQGQDSEQRSPRPPQEEAGGGAVKDERHTPLYLFPDRVSDTLYTNLLDSYSQAKQRICQNTRLDLPNRCDEEEQLFEKLVEDNVENAVVIICKSWTKLSPCDYGPWGANTHWIWVDSGSICGDRDDDSEGWQRRCPQNIQVHSLALPTKTVDAIEEEHSYTGRSGPDMIYLYNMTLEVDKLLGAGVINAQTVKYVRAQLQQLEELELTYQQGVELEEELDWSKDMEVLVMGESVADRIGGQFKELLEESMPCVQPRLEDTPFPHVRVINAANRGELSTAYFIPCSDDLAPQFFKPNGPCGPDNVDTRAEVLMAIPTSKPDVVVLHDSHWAGSKYLEDADREEALNNMLQQAKEAGVKKFYFMTSSVVGKKTTKKAMEEEVKLITYLRSNSCQPYSRWKGISFTIFRWHLLTCPAFEEGTCPHEAHGFSDILPDGLHPSGISGEWLTGQVLATIVADASRKRTWHHGKWDEAIANPISACVLDSQVPDNNPPLDDLLVHYDVCP